MKGLLSVSFGTSYAQTREKTIDVIDRLLEGAFEDRAFFSAWTSGRIVAKVREERGELHDTLDEAFARLSDQGVDDLLIATMCLMEGHEMKKVASMAAAWAQEAQGRTVHVAAPLLDSQADRAVMAEAICEEFANVQAGEALLLMGHGSPNGPNEVYAQMQEELRKTGSNRFFMATVEGTPTFEDALEQLHACGVSRVWLAPFMMVAGDHATNDLAGEGDDAWKSRLGKEGFEVSVVLKGLGQYQRIQQLVVVHARSVCEGA